MDDVVDLISEVSTTDEDFNAVSVETPRQVFCKVRSVTRSEFYSGGQAGINPAYVLELFMGDYNGEKLCSFHNAKYAIYRTYNRLDDDVVELYIEEKVGVTDADDEP